MLRKIPKAIWIGAHKYEVVLSDGLVDCGVSDLNAHKIFLDSSQPFSKLADTLIHEIIEISNDMREMKLSHRKIQVLATDIAQALLYAEVSCESSQS